MPKALIEPNTIVRYSETSTRWFIALVRKVYSVDAEIEYLSKKCETVPLDKLEPFIPYLKSRDRVVSLKREDLCYVLYGHSLDRLRQDRIDEMQKYLRKYGIRFRPDEWIPGSRIQIRPDDSVVGVATITNDPAYESLLPKWMEPTRLPPGSRDPLGFQGYAEKIANEFLPGLTVFTTRIGYYGFLAWAVRELNNQKFPAGTNRHEMLHRLERAFVLCEFVYHGNEETNCRVIGQRSKSEVLQTANDDRFRVPRKIMKNQESGGSFRLYSTSLVSNGFAEVTPELGADGFLPLTITNNLGMRLAREYEKRVPEGFVEFALNDSSVDRDKLRDWGKQLCLSCFGGLKYYRTPFLEGYLLGNSQAAETRYKTVSLLFERKLLLDNSRKRRMKINEILAEEDIAALETDDGLNAEGLSNADVLLRFYEEKPSRDIAHIRIQKAAVFELLSLAHSAIFAHAIHVLDGTVRCKVDKLHDSIVSSAKYGKLWKKPFDQVGRNAPSARELEAALFAAESTAEQAAIGGILMARIVNDRAFQILSSELAGSPVVALLEPVPMDKSLSVSFAQLLETMVLRHEHVSINKNRQRWCYLDNGDLVRDDLRPMAIGWHAMRFPQVYALCRDAHLTKEDLAHGK